MTSAESKSSIRSLSRALDILEALAESERDLSLSEIAGRVGLHTSTAHRFLEALVDRHYVRKNPTTGQFSLGTKMLQISGKKQNQYDYLRGAARSTLERLVQATNESANLAVLDGHEAVYIDQVQCSRSVRLFTQTGARVPLYCTGIGKVLLAYLPRAEAHRLVASIDYQPYTDRTISGPRQLEEELERVRRLGYAIDDEEREQGARCASAPVFEQGNQIVAAISVSAPSFRISREGLDELGSLVREACRELSQELGFPE